MDSWWFSGIALLLYVCIGAGVIVAWSDIFIKAGYSRWLCFLVIIPVINLIVFFWFAFSKWPIHEVVSRDWRITRLKQKKEKIEQELKLMSVEDTSIQDTTLKNKNQLDELRLQYKQAKKSSENYFLLAAKYPDNSLEKESNFRMGTEYKLKAETLEKQLENEQ
jgi:hypothetical protein